MKQLEFGLGRTAKKEKEKESNCFVVYDEQDIKGGDHMFCVLA